MREATRLCKAEPSIAPGHVGHHLGRWNCREPVDVRVACAVLATSGSSLAAAAQEDDMSADSRCRERVEDRRDIAPFTKIAGKHEKMLIRRNCQQCSEVHRRSGNLRVGNIPDYYRPRASVSLLVPVSN